ncbi:MAG TPA: hypothetical protein VNJ50_01285 [Gelidibacter sp.]|uniref:hypothetical protein n=1 Tax=Gelidibacter sp. TaxID=2018083 RepID=UPI002BF50B3E|nr:hypothetical protein [Gelidibacter sp.]HXJ97455.1 hypothetical protein [Gelidibacter sp.]
MKETKTSQLIDKVLGSFQVFLTLSYLFAIGIGMLFNYYKYNYFGINIFDYASVFDFLIAPFADFRILSFTLLTLIVTYLLFAFDNFWQKRGPASYARFSFNLVRFKWYQNVKWSFFLIIFISYLILVAQGYGKLTHNEVSNQKHIAVHYIEGQSELGQLIGKTSDMLFLNQKTGVIAIPISSMVKSIQIK